MTNKKTKSNELRYSGPSGVESLEDRLFPAGSFVGCIDQLLSKHLPESSIPWPTSQPPIWAQGFSPREIVDLGSGVGGFICSVLTSLAFWGCLSRLERILLVEYDATIMQGGAEALKNHLISKVTKVLSDFGLNVVTVEVCFKKIEVIESNRHDVSLSIPLLDSHFLKADLIIASHLTYYIGDGSGLELVAAINQNYLASHGLLWCVIRKRSCPIYEARACTLKTLGLVDVKPFDYAEYFEKEVIPQLKGVRLIEERDQWFLQIENDSRWREAAYWLMWREIPPTQFSTPFAKAVTDLISQDSPLFAERHFIMERKVTDEQPER